MRRLSVCATGRPSRPRALNLGAVHRLSASATAVLLASRALCRRTRDSCAIADGVSTSSQVARGHTWSYVSRGLRALASCGMAAVTFLGRCLLVLLPKMFPSMTVWLYGDDVINSVIIVISKTFFVVDFEKRTTVRTMKRGFVLTEVTYLTDAI